MHRSREVIKRGPQTAFRSLLPLKAAQQILVIRLDPLRAPVSPHVRMRAEHALLQRALHRRRNLLVNREDVAQVAFVAF